MSEISNQNGTTQFVTPLILKLPFQNHHFKITTLKFSFQNYHFKFLHSKLIHFKITIQNHHSKCHVTIPKTTISK